MLTEYYMDDRPGPWVRCVIESDKPGYSSGRPSFIIKAGAKRSDRTFVLHGERRHFYEHFVYRTIIYSLHRSL